MTQTQSDLEIQGQTSFPASKKVYATGSRDDIRVPFREVTLTPTSGRFGDEQNAPLNVYDTSGPYSDPAAASTWARACPPCAGPGSWSGATWRSTTLRPWSIAARTRASPSPACPAAPCAARAAVP